MINRSEAFNEVRDWFAELGLPNSDVVGLTTLYHELRMEGWTVGNAKLYLSYTEEINPDISEETAAARMAMLRKVVKEGK